MDVDSPAPPSIVSSAVASPAIENKKKGRPSTGGTPFQRVKSDQIQFADDSLRDNSYQAHVAKKGFADWGAKASEKLFVTRGQGFTKAKNKLKKGAYSGGTIGMESNSYKFTYDDE